MRFLTRSLIGLFLLSLTVGFLAFAGLMITSAMQSGDDDTRHGAGSRERVFSVNVITVYAQNLRPELTVFGEVRARRSLDLRAAISGRVIEIADNFVDGGAVEAGQLLMRIDPAEARSALDRAVNNLAEAQANLRDAERSLILAGEDLVASEAQRDLRQTALARQQDLRTRGVGTEASVEAAELAASQSDQAVVARRQSLAQAEAGVDQATTGLARQNLAVSDAERHLQDTKIYAEFDGTLGEVSIVKGGLVSTNERIAILTDPSQLEVSFRVSTAQYTRLLNETGQLREAPVNVALDVLGIDLINTGVVTRESGTVGTGQTGRLLFARLETSAGFRPGDFVTVSVEEHLLKNVVRLPSSAWDTAGNVLAIDAEDRLEILPTDLLRRQGNDVILSAAGLEGREVVAERSPLFGAGIRVKPVRSGGADVAETEDLIELTDDRRAALIAFVEANKRMPDEARTRVLNQLSEPRVPLRVVERIESRMGG